MDLLHKLHDTLRGSSQQPLNAAVDSHHSHSPTVKLVNRTFNQFYSSKHSQFEAPAASDGTLGANDHYGYTVWPVIIHVQSLADAVIAGGPPKSLRLGLAALQQYWNAEKHGFCAWKFYPGNTDIYYDDNAHAAQALISAYEALRDQNYLQQAAEILKGLIIPAFEDVKGDGVPWHISDHSSRNACSTGPAGVAALRLCRIHEDPSLGAFAERALQWVWFNLQDSDGLISDNVKIQLDGSRRVETKKWTYNTGFAIHGAALLYQRTRNPAYLEKGSGMARAALEKTGALFDQAIPKEEDRMYADGSYFLHHLVDGFVALSEYCLRDELVKEVAHVTDFGRDFCFDAKDGLYYRGSKPYTISEELAKKFNAKYGAQKCFEREGSERDEHGNLCKTLIGCSGWARVGFMAERLCRLHIT